MEKANQHKVIHKAFLRVAGSFIKSLIVPFWTSLSSIEKSNCSKLGGGFLLNLQAKV